MPDYQHLRYERDQHTVTMTFFSQKGLNALHRPLLAELDLAMDQVESEEGLRLLLFKAEGKAFIAGADIGQMAPLGPEEGRLFGQMGQALFTRIESLSVPTLAVIDGFTLGGGNELAMACDFRIATDRSKFGQPEVTLGITPGFGGTFRLARLVGMARAKELLLTGKIINAKEALSMGLVNEVVSPEELEKTLETWVGQLVKNAPLAVAYTKKAIEASMGKTSEEGNAIEAAYFGLCFGTEDQKTGMKAFLSKEKPHYKGR